jgi:hypothetical protein
MRYEHLSLSSQQRRAVGAPAISWDAPGIIFLKLLAVVFLVLLNGFFVASEFAIVKVRSSQLDALAARGNGHADLVQRFFLDWADGDCGERGTPSGWECASASGISPVGLGSWRAHMGPA